MKSSLLRWNSTEMQYQHSRKYNNVKNMSIGYGCPTSSYSKHVLLGKATSTTPREEECGKV